MPLVHLCVAGVQPQYLALSDDAKVYELTYEHGGREHRLKLQAGNHSVAPASSPSPSSLPPSSVPSSSALANSPPTGPRERQRAVNTHAEGKQQQQQQPVCVTVWYDAQNRQSDATTAPSDDTKQTPLYGVVCNTNQPHRLDALPGSPVVWVCAGEAGVEKVATMARAVRSEFSWVDVPEGIEATEDEIRGDFHAEIKLPSGPRHVTCHDGRAYVTHGAPGDGSAVVSVFDVANHSLVQTILLHGGGWANGVVVHDQSVYVANGVLNCIQVYGLDDGKFQRQFGTLGDGPGQFKHPHGLALSDGEPEPLLYVCDFFNDRVQVFGLNGSHVRSFGAVGDGPGFFKYPSALAVDGDFVYVCDTFNNRVQVFGLDGTFQRMWGSKGVGEGEFIWPRGVVVQGELLYVSDMGNHRVQVFEKKTGTFVRSWGSQGAGPGQFLDPSGMAMSDEGQLWVCDCNNQRVQVFE